MPHNKCMHWELKRASDFVSLSNRPGASVVKTSYWPQCFSPLIADVNIYLYLGGNMFVKSSKKAVLIYILIFLSSCSPQVIDDFFGIQMDKEYADKFEIVSYTAKEGAKYKSNIYMDPDVFAYAEFTTNSIHIKIGNFGSEVIKINYNLDEFYLYTYDEKFALSRGNREKYSDKKEIKINHFMEFDLELPTNFAETVGMTNPQSETANYTIEFWKGQNTLNMIKEKIKYIEVNFGSNITLILKPIP